MNLRLALSALALPSARESAARWLLAACVAGYLVTLAILLARGAGPQRWFFALLAWALFAYVPLRIVLETLQTIGPAMRQALADQAAARPDRYASRGSIELLVDRFYRAHVVMPRIARPVEGVRARAGAVAVLVSVTRPNTASFSDVLTRCLATIDQAVHDLGIQFGREGTGNIQARWTGVRALTALAALTKVVLVAAEDRGDMPLPTDLPPRLADEYLDACLDYCDDLAIQVEVVPWTEPLLDLGVRPDLVAAVWERWMRYCEIEPPAVDARTAFVGAIAEP